MESGKDFLSDIFYYLPPRIRAFFLKLPPNICDEITEIRLRADKPVSIVTRNGCAFITSGGRMNVDLSISPISKRFSIGQLMREIS